ncbi:Gfo/Idh/MocA family protein [Herbiconiux ginsengi]|uniref:Predicted dehydrogenase n=1 Tax=Herbiconiux ginsengi TaxID=381665 RepID=A0A1H3MSL6_9MICO|nr:Gfo/Idh/MocA family oxidoreductase [Herbiconiux ginsengi]SDY79661.1 Predicted dehydrogenase [Herbiconiux ginsengi]
MSQSDGLRVALIGTGFMGRAHANAWLTAPRFFALPRAVRPALVVGRDPARTRAAAESFGWESWSTDWREAVQRDDIDAVDICVPGNLHAEMTLAALAAGKHVLCEKPLANSVGEAEIMTDAAQAAESLGVLSMCGFSYRRTPALALAKRLIDDGRIGRVRHVRAQYLQDWLSDATAPMTWRLDKEQAGSGTLGDIGAHSVDLAQWLTGSRISGVSALLHTFVSERPASGEQVGLGGTGDTSGARAAVTVDDAAAFTARFDDGAVGVFEATRMALGRKNANRIEINGTRGSVAFDFERMNELEFFESESDSLSEGFRRVQATEAGHPYLEGWWPVGHGLGYEHTFTHEVVDFVRAIGAGTAPSPSFGEALQVQRVLAAVERSAADDSRFTHVDKENR